MELEGILYISVVEEERIIRQIPIILRKRRIFGESLKYNDLDRYKSCDEQVWKTNGTIGPAIIEVNGLLHLRSP